MRSVQRASRPARTTCSTAPTSRVASRCCQSDECGRSPKRDCSRAWAYAYERSARLMTRGGQPPREARDGLVGEFVERAEVDARRRRAALELLERALEAGLGGAVDAGGSRAGTLEQPAALCPRRFDHRLGFTLCGSDR